MPRLPMLIRLAEVLDVDDLAELTGEARLSRVTYSKRAPGDLDSIRNAMASPVDRAGAPASPTHFAHRVATAWRVWHSSETERDAVAPMLPELISDGRAMMRALDGTERRDVARDLARTYHLAQLYASHTPAAELVYMTGDRAMLAAEYADDPIAVAGAAWYMNHVWRDAGEAAEARVDVATDAASMLRPADSTEERALYSLMHLAVALSHAKLGKDGEAWFHYDRATRAAASLDGYVHPWLMIGRGMVEHYAVTIHLDLQKPGLAVKAANAIRPSGVPSRTRQSRYLVEVARAHHRQGDAVAAVHLMSKARSVSVDTFSFSLFARSMVAEMLPGAPASVEGEVRDLARTLHLIT